MNQLKLLKILQLACLIVPVSIGLVNGQTDSVYYHTGHFTTQYGANGSYPSYDYYRFTTRFTPAWYPAQLTGIKAWFRNAAQPSNIKFVVYKDPSGAANGPLSNVADYISPLAIPNPASGGIPDSAYSGFTDLEPEQILITAGDVYCGVTQSNINNGFAGMAIDTANNYPTDRPWALVGGIWIKMITWTFINGEWGISAYFTPYGVSAETGIPGNQASLSVYPSPADNHTVLTYQLQENAVVSVKILNLLESEVMVVANNEKLAAGIHSSNISLETLSPGLYIISLTTGSLSQQIKLLKMQ
ncbi:MAG: T9SS type A sorting domain-containing protein [Bacteroidetes bacterium]|nr:T9SS type A sorting domain-containing protein [Bacteroidota bacterium]